MIFIHAHIDLQQSTENIEATCALKRQVSTSKVQITFFFNNVLKF